MTEQDSKDSSAASGLIGRVIAGKLRIDKQLGAGAMGAVYQARHLGLDKDVAIKVLHPAASGDASHAARFKAEARGASRIDHPNVVRILDFGEDGDDHLLYLAMEFLRGDSLHSVAHREGQMSEVRACWIVAQVLSALSSAHEQGVIHRDIKPGNIMLVSKQGDEGIIHDVVKVCDFGLAKLFNNDGTDYEGTSGPLTQQGSVFGTPAFMSPEQARGEILDPRSDLYSCGVVLYRLVAGKNPFSAETTVGLLLRQINDLPESPKVSAPHLSDALEGIILRALEKDPQKRFKDAREMRKALLACMKSSSSVENEAYLNLLSGASDEDELISMRSLASDFSMRKAQASFDAESNNSPQESSEASIPPTLPRLLQDMEEPSLGRNPARNTSNPISFIKWGVLAILGIAIGVGLGIRFVGTVEPTEVSVLSSDASSAVPVLEPKPSPKVKQKSVVEKLAIANTSTQTELKADPKPSLMPNAASENNNIEQPVMKKPSDPSAAKKKVSRRKVKSKTKATKMVESESVSSPVMPVETVAERAPKTSKAILKGQKTPSKAALPTSSPPTSKAQPQDKVESPRIGTPPKFNFKTLSIRIEGGISKQKTSRAFSKKVDSVSSCLRDALIAQGLPRTLESELTVLLNDRGRVKKIDFENKSLKVEACLKSAFSAIRFPRSDTGEAHIRFRFKYGIK